MSQFKRSRKGWLVIAAAACAIAGCSGGGTKTAQVTSEPTVRYSTRKVYADGAPVPLNDVDCPEDYTRSVLDACVSPSGTPVMSAADVAWRVSVGRLQFKDK